MRRDEEGGFGVRRVSLAGTWRTPFSCHYWVFSTATNTLEAGVCGERPSAGFLNLSMIGESIAGSVMERGDRCLDRRYIRILVRFTSEDQVIESCLMPSVCGRRTTRRYPEDLVFG